MSTASDEFIDRVIATPAVTSRPTDARVSADPDEVSVAANPVEEARPVAPSAGLPGNGGRASEPRRSVVGSSVPRQEPVVRPRGLPRAGIAAQVPSPEHHHLPGWVRRTYGQARPILADLLGLLEGDLRATFQASVDDLTTRVSSGKFSLAWEYPALINQGMALYEKQRADSAAVAVSRRNFDTTRRKVSDQLRESSLAADVQSRLTKALRSASDAESIRAVEAEISQATVVARTSQEKRRDREIERTRARIKAGAPRAADGPTESWQDVLRRFADTQAEAGGTDHS